MPSKRGPWAGSRQPSSDGISNRATVVKIHQWDWYVALGVPETVLLASPNQEQYFLFIQSFLVIITSVLGSLLVARYVSYNMNEVMQMLQSLKEGSMHQRGPNPIRELDNIARVIKDVSDQDHQIKTSIVSYKADRDKAIAELQNAHLDALTGLPGRILFLELADAKKSSLLQKERGAIALFFIDLDGFKSINDTMGHACGDQVLRDVGAILRSVTRDSDIACRLGGDEFLLLITGDQDQLFTSMIGIAQRIIAMISALGNGLSCSLGIATINREGEVDIAKAIERADAAMYQAKRNGKNQFVLAEG